jgi:hypothetical protein
VRLSLPDDTKRTQIVRQLTEPVELVRLGHGPSECLIGWIGRRQDLKLAPSASDPFV